MDKSPDQALKYLQSKRDPYDFLHLSTGEMISNLDDKVVNSFNKKTISFISNISKTNSLDFIPKFLKEVLFFVLSEKEKEEFNRNLAVGILPILSFNAVCRESPQPYNGYLIFLNMGFSLFCCELLKISLGVLSNKINHLEFIKFSKKLYQSYFINKKHLHCDLILDEADNKILSKLIDGINLFAFFHEYSHYSLDHLSCAKEMKLLDGLLTNLTLKKKQEKDADLNSCNLILKFYKISPQQAVTMTRRLTKIFKDDEEEFLLALNRIEKELGIDIIDELAGSRFVPWVAQGFGSPLRQAGFLGAAGAGAIINPLIFLALPLFSPRVVGRLATTAGRGKQIFQKAATTPAGQLAGGTAGRIFRTGISKTQ